MLKKLRDGSKKSAFILANSIVAACLIVMAVVWLGLCEHQLKMQREKMVTSLKAARVAKEATDHCVVNNLDHFLLSDPPFVATVSHDRVVVREGRQTVYEVQ